MFLQRANLYCAELSPYQAQAMSQWVGACRYVYNEGLKRRNYEYDNYGFSLRYPMQQSDLTKWRHAKEWLMDPPGHALQIALQALDDAFQRFLKGLCKHPTPRKKFRDDSFTLMAADVEFKKLNRNHGAIKLPKIGWIKFRGYRDLGGALRSVTFRRKAGEWSVSCAWEADVPDPPKNEGLQIGVDRGVTCFAALSDGRMYKPLNAFKKIKDDLAGLQQQLAKKVKFSSNWRKVKQKISRLRHHEANARKDWLHKLSTEIAKNHGIVKLEKLRVRNMTASAAGTIENPGKNVAQKSGLNRSILDQGLGMFGDMLGYKCPQFGGHRPLVAAPYTSQTCCKCGVVDAASRRSQSEFVCTACGHADNADVNAAGTIEQARTLAVVPPRQIRKRSRWKRKPRDGAHAV